MDSTSLSLCHALCCTTDGQRQVFDLVFQRFIVGDESGHSHGALDSVVASGCMPATAMILVYGFLYPTTHYDVDNDEELVIALSVALLSKDLQGDVISRQRLNWCRHVNSLKWQGLFCLYYRMSYEAFNGLLNLLQSDLEVNATKPRNQTSNQQPIGLELTLHCILRYLAGASYLDVIVHTSISRAEFYSCVYKGINAICRCKELQIKMPMSLSDMHNAANSFKEFSLDGRLNGCIGALDGWLGRIRVPSASDTMNVASYFSGHYQSYSVNVQATCDAAYRFTLISVLCPGSAGDSKAFAASFVQQYVSSLLRGFYMVANNAYTLSDTLLIPYCGVDKLDPSKDVFKFYLSQLHIRIERAFGLLVSKWRIFKKPLEVKLFHVGHIVQACARLHNYCINNRDENIPVIINRDPDSFAPNFEAFYPPVQT
jgi:hypothetical protein